MLHFDLDQFIAAVEVLRHPELRGLPVVVGGDGDPTKRGVVSTASYEARAHGVHSGLALRTAARRCPEAVFLPVDKSAYEAASEVVMRTLREFDAVVEVMGWDEAFLAVETSDPEGFAREIQRQVKAVTQLDSSLGIGQNKLQAKIATGFGKPAGVFRITSDTWLEVLGDKPTDALWGVGSRTAKRLAELSIMTVAELAAASPRELAPHFGPTIGPWLVQLGRGIDLSRVTAEPWVARSRSREVTFQTNLVDWAQVGEEVAKIAQIVSSDVAAEGRLAARIVVKVRFAPFFTKTHGRALAEPTADPAAIEAAALAALEGFTRRDPVRLLGVRAEFADSSDSSDSSGSD
ncbi:MAG TPA: DNA polymerase IV [Streptosporangiaceae bacterium]|nr:DNA polymerase IV [Streptosporangiaceae bacterium]